jgi:hypothetical protein
MKINFDSEVLNLENKPLVETIDGKVVNYTLKKICVNALMANIPTPQNAPQETGMEKFKKFELSKKIYNGGEVEVTAEDITLIKKQVGVCYGAIIVGPVYNLLECVKK